MRVTLRSEALSLILILAMFAVAAATWPAAPDRIPVHWGPTGQPDRYGAKFEGLLLVPLMAVGLYLLLVALPRLDPRRKHYESFEGAYAIMRTSFIALLAAVHFLIVLWVRGHRVDMVLVTFVLIGILFIVLGNYMPKIRSNWFTGIRDPWTLSSEESWRKTQRLGGKLFLLAGLVMIVVGIIRPASTAWLVGPILVFVAASFGLSVYSYLVWKQDRRRQGVS